MPPIPKSSYLRNVGVVVVLGVAFQFVLDALYRYVGGYIVQFVFGVGKALDLGEAALHTFTLTAGPTCEAAILGVLFGVPLALLVSRHIVGHWLLFVGTVMAMHFLSLVLTESDIGWLVAVWTFPITWLNMVAILGVAFVTARYRHPVGSLAPNAP
jgi:hypothetical protein